MSTNTTNQQEASSKSTETFISALALNAAIAGGEVVAWLIIRRYFPHIFQPRTKLPERKEDRSEPLPGGLLSAIPAIFKADDEQIVDKNGLDAYLFVRFIKLMTYLFGGIALVTWAVLLPVYGTSTTGNSGLNRFTFGNVGRDQQARLAAPLVLCWVSTLFILYMLWREYHLFVERRRAFLTSKRWATKAQSRVVLVTGIPEKHCDMESLQHFAGAVGGGGVRKIWLARDTKTVDDLYERRTKAVQKLEKADNKVIKLANKLVRKNKVPREGKPAEELQGKKGADKEIKHADTLLSRYIPEKKRPTNRLGKIPLIGKKVDTLDWAVEEIETTNAELDQKRADFNSFKNKSSAFILFNDQIDAHNFCRSLSKTPLKMSSKYTDVSPDDVIWDNLNINAYSHKVRSIVSWAVTVTVIIFWSIPTAFVTSISNVSSLCNNVSWLSWLCTLPVPVNGIIQGILPPVALAILFALLPPFFRLLAKLQGIPLQSRIERSLQRRYFSFLFVQGFIVATLSSGIMAGISQITDNPSSTVSLLAENLPKASVFFLTLVVTSGLSGAAGNLLQIARLAIYYVKEILLGGTPRSLYNIRYTMPDSDFGILFPAQLLLVTIALAYSTIAPLVCGFAFVSFSLFWFCHKYLFIWVMDQDPAGETAGLYFKTALNQFFCGLYIEHLCLIGLFFLARNQSNGLSALAEGILMAILLAITIAFHVFLNFKYGKQSLYLPESMGEQMRANETRYAQEMAAERQGSRGGAPLQYSQSQETRRDSGALNREKGVLGKEAANADPEKRAAAAGQYGSDNGMLHPRAVHPAGHSPPLTDDEATTVGHRSHDLERGGNSDGVHNSGNGSVLENVASAEGGQRQGEGDLIAEDEDEIEGGLDENAFYHPALYRGQPTIWIIHDDLGISSEAVRDGRARGVDITDEDTSMNEKGKVDIYRKTLPGLDWTK